MKMSGISPKGLVEDLLELKGPGNTLCHQVDHVLKPKGSTSTQKGMSDTYERQKRVLADDWLRC